MERIILIRIGEIFLNGNNKNFFINLLKENIKNSLNGVDCKLVSSQNRMFVEGYVDDDEGEIISRLTKVFGIYNILRYSAATRLPETYARIPSVAPMIAEVPVASPSIPSVRFAPFDTAATTRIVIMMNTSHASISA